VLPFTLLLVVLSGEPQDRFAVVRGAQTYDLDWSDAEDRVSGTLRPLDPVEDQPLQVALAVGTFQGTDFDGPVSLTVRCADWSQTQTVVRGKGAKAWLAEFTPAANGECFLDVGWQTTRRKLLHMAFRVTPAPIARTPWYVLLGALATLALGLGIRAALKKPEA
jgi:hypothetical protein